MEKTRRILMLSLVLISLVFFILTDYNLFKGKLAFNSFVKSVNLDQVKSTGIQDKYSEDDKRCFHMFWATLDAASLPEDCRFMTINTRGRCGNQIFQIASLLGTAYRHDFIPIINEQNCLTELFELPNVSKIPILNSKRLSDSACCKYMESFDHIDKRNNWTLSGYLCSWRYFSGAEHIIRMAFKMKEKYLKTAAAFLKTIARPGCQNVCIHARMGDFASATLIKLGYIPANAGFVTSAIDLFEKRLNKVQFVVLSDDMDWCKVNIKGEHIYYSPFKDIGYDRALMRLCDHMVVTSGTFGWWGGWFVKGTTVYNTGFPKKDTWLSAKFTLNDYYPGDWIGIP